MVLQRCVIACLWTYIVQFLNGNFLVENEAQFEELFNNFNAYSNIISNWFEGVWTSECSFTYKSTY